MVMEDPRSLAMEWLQAGADYDQGTALYARVGKNRNMASLFPGKKYRMESKLRYELCKSVGLDWKKLPLRVEFDAGMAAMQPVPITGSVSSFSSASASVSASPVSFATALSDSELPVLDESEQYPSDVRRVIHEYGEGYRKRSQLHLQMTSLPENNQPETVARRRDLLMQIKAFSLRMEVLFQAKENYQLHRIVPDPAVLWPEPAVSPGYASRDKPLPDDSVELRRLKKNLQTYNVKDNNMLLYQSVTAQSEKHPMPDGPRRLGLEKRIRGRLRTISQIELKLVEDAD